MIIAFIYYQLQKDSMYQVGRDKELEKESIEIKTSLGESSLVTPEIGTYLIRFICISL